MSYFPQFDRPHYHLRPVLNLVKFLRHHHRQRKKLKCLLWC
jgi:hypothetical protein